MAKKDNRKKRLQKKKKKSQLQQQQQQKQKEQLDKEQVPIGVITDDIPKDTNNVIPLKESVGAEASNTIDSQRDQEPDQIKKEPVIVTKQDIPALKHNKLQTSQEILTQNITTPVKQNIYSQHNNSSSNAAIVSSSASPSMSIPMSHTDSVDAQNRNEIVDEVSRILSPSNNDLTLPGGDITRDLYKWTNEHANTNTLGETQPNNFNSPTHMAHSPIRTANLFPENNMNTPSNMGSHRKRSMSFSALSINSSTLNSLILPNPQGRTYSTTTNNNNSNSNAIQQPVIMTHEEIRAPGGFRRSYILHRHKNKNVKVPDFFTRNFIEFLTLYGHFAGEDLSDSESESEDMEADDETTDIEVIESDNETTSLLLTQSTSHRHHHHEKHKSSTFKAVLLLLKSFVGTGVLFLPRAFHNGGWAFSSLCLLFCAIISYYCFILLINTKNKIGVNGYGEMGQTLYGSTMKFAILSSIALSQLGFAAAYTVFTATNLKVFVDNVFGFSKEQIHLAMYIVLQAIIFIPLSLTRNIAKLSGTALIADLFILLGLLYVYYYASFHVIQNGIADSMIFFNQKDWSLFIGTAIFTFEGIGLLIPIQESMRHPEQFQKSLSGVMVIVTVIFISCGLICYSAFGSKVETVVLLNFPQQSPMTLTVQLLYALAILLSTPLQLFPAIRILEHWTFPANASGKHNPRVKWLKNYFRTFVVILAATMAWVGANDLDKFVSLVGSLACIPLIYIHPPLLHYKATLQEGLGSMTTRTKTKLILDILLCIFGVIVMAYTSWQTIVLWIN